MLICVLFGMQEKKAFDIAVINFKKISGAVADFFVLCSANTDTQVDAIATEVEKQVAKQLKQNPWQREGFQNKEWVLIDYCDVVVHIFRKEKRAFYDLENLWGDADITYIGENDIIDPNIIHESQKTNVRKDTQEVKKKTLKKTNKESKQKNINGREQRKNRK